VLRLAAFRLGETTGQTNVKRIAILHYAGPPKVGGVESTIAYQARELTQLGYPVRVVSGAGDAFDPLIEHLIHPLFNSSHPDILRTKSQLDAGQVTPDFTALVERLTADLRAELSGCEVCIAHNILSLHKNLPLTAALARLNREKAVQIIAWCHDLAWTNAQYQPEVHPGYPWDLLRQAWPDVRYVTVSKPRQVELAALLGVPQESVSVVVPGIDPARFFRWTETTDRLVHLLGLMDADGILLLPARLTRRKNIELALHILAEIRRQSGRDFRLIVTGPPGPHNPGNRGYLDELIDLQDELSLEDSAHFLYVYGESDDSPLVPDDDTLADFFQIADALLFPSTQEGFGIPVLEAGLVGIPAFCADIPPLRETGGMEAVYFDPLTTAPEQVAVTILKTLQASPTYRLRVRVRQSYRWDTLIRDHIVPLLEAP
jgi:glycosyltransferase involved in cell wall biosynthesis